jgi:hypothetical protein
MIAGERIWRGMKKIIVIIFVIFNHCSLATFQSPKTMEPGKAVVGIGACTSFMPEAILDGNFQLSLHGRYGLTRNLDAGLSVFTLGALADIKYQFLTKPMAAFSIGVSYCPPVSFGFGGGGGTSITGIYPQIIIGTENKYAGIKCIYIREKDGRDITYNFLPGIFIGNRIGRKFKIVPEVDGYGVFGDENTGWMLLIGIAVQYDF